MNRPAVLASFSLAAVSALLVAKRVPVAAPARVSPAAAFIPKPDVVETHQVLVRAPSALVFQTAAHLDMQSIPLVRFLFWLRGRLMGDATKPRKARGLAAETLALGWGVLQYERDRTLVMGAAAQPWMRNVSFDPIPPDAFAAFAEGDAVKIVWTLEVEPLGPAVTRFRTETRVAATSHRARRLFRGYWRWRMAGAGIVLIRKALLRAIRRHAERQHRDACLAKAA
jgi:hypothetical protein